MFSNGIKNTYPRYGSYTTRQMMTKNELYTLHIRYLPRTKKIRKNFFIGFMTTKIAESTLMKRLRLRILQIRFLGFYLRYSTVAVREAFRLLQQHNARQASR